MLYFIYNNLKVNPFILHDSAYPGFELLTWDKESWTQGTLWDIGHDAGYSVIGNANVCGQLWICRDNSKESDVAKLFGVEIGISRPIEVKVKIKPNGDTQEDEVSAKTFALNNIEDSYIMIKNGFWTIKRLNDKEIII